MWPNDSLDFDPENSRNFSVTPLHRSTKFGSARGMAMIAASLPTKRLPKSFDFVFEAKKLLDHCDGICGVCHSTRCRTHRIVEQCERVGQSQIDSKPSSVQNLR
jgi:hypothetical protein